MHVCVRSEGRPLKGCLPPLRPPQHAMHNSFLIALLLSPLLYSVSPPPVPNYCHLLSRHSTTALALGGQQSPTGCRHGWRGQACLLCVLSVLHKRHRVFKQSCKGIQQQGMQRMLAAPRKRDQLGAGAVQQGRSARKRGRGSSIAQGLDLLGQNLSDARQKQGAGCHAGPPPHFLPRPGSCAVYLRGQRFEARAVLSHRLGSASVVPQAGPADGPAPPPPFPQGRSRVHQLLGVAQHVAILGDCRRGRQRAAMGHTPMGGALRRCARCPQCSWGAAPRRAGHAQGSSGSSGGAPAGRGAP